MVNDEVFAGSLTVNIGANEQGKRTDLASAVETMRSTKSLKALAEQHPTTYVKYHRGFEALWTEICSQSRDRSQGVGVCVLWGPTGTGKTKRAYDLASDLQGLLGKQYYVKPSYNMWWDGYRGEPVVIIDEYTGQWPIAYLLLVLDRYPMKLEVKGGTVNLAATTFLITSNVPPAEWYINASLEQKAALERRITQNLNVTSLEEEYHIEV